MSIVHANNKTTISLGRQGENLARQVVFDLSDWVSGYGDGTAELIYQRPGDERPYPVAAVREGSTLVWTVSNADTAVEASYGSYGRCELRWYVGDVLVKSKTWRTWVEPAMGTPTETAPPAPEQGWVDQVLAAGAATKASADAAKADADRATLLAAEVAEKAAQTAQDATASAQAKEAAQTAQRLAEDAQRAAETAKQAAEAAQAAVAQSANDAEAAKQGAESAWLNAQAAASAAAHALSDIQELYQQMQTWAQGVIQTVGEAADSAGDSAVAAGNAADAAKDAQRGADDAKTKAEASKEESAKSEAAAKLSEQNSKASEDAAKAYEDNAASSASTAAESANDAQAAQSNAESARDAAALSAGAAAQSAKEAAESAAVYDDVVADVDQLKEDFHVLTKSDAQHSRDIKLLQLASEGVLYTEETDTDTAYEKAIPSGALPYATLEKIGGATIVDGDALKSASVDKVLSIGKNKLKPYPGYRAYGANATSTQVIKSNIKDVVGVCEVNPGEKIKLNTKTGAGFANRRYFWFADNPIVRHDDIVSIGGEYGSPLYDGAIITAPENAKFLAIYMTDTGNESQYWSARKDLINGYVPYFGSELQIPEEIRSLQGYGQSNGNKVNTVDYINKVYRKAGYYGDDGEWVDDAKNMDVSAFIPDDFEVLEVEGGGTLTFHHPEADNGLLIPVPSTESYIVKTGGTAV